MIFLTRLLFFHYFYFPKKFQTSCVNITFSSRILAYPNCRGDRLGMLCSLNMYAIPPIIHTFQGSPPRSSGITAPKNYIKLPINRTKRPLCYHRQDDVLYKIVEDKEKPELDKYLIATSAGACTEHVYRL